jgi:hypothetical protein
MGLPPGAGPRGMERLSRPLNRLTLAPLADLSSLLNQAEVDQYLHTQDAGFASMANQSRKSNPLLYKKLAEARPSPTRD